MSSGRLVGKIAVITGSSSGIGRAIALAYAMEGANIVCSDIREEARTEKAEASELTTVQEVEKLGQKVIFVRCDTSKEEDVENLIKRAVETFKRVDIMVNNAGIILPLEPIWELSSTTFDQAMAINLRGVFLGIKYASLQMKDQSPSANGDRGWIINLASVAGLNGLKSTAAYTTSKHGVIGLTKSAALDCAEHRIHVNALCPGFTATALIQSHLENPQANARITSLHPFRGLGTPEDIARAAVFLGSEDAGWVTGIGLPVDGGYCAM